MPDPTDPLSRLADALLVAEATYQKARDHHERERTVTSQRVLLEARHRLEYLEGQMFNLPREPAAESGCDHCGGEVRVERWSAVAAPRRAAQLGGQTVMIVEPMPDWAAPHALGGTAVVVRYTCALCGEELRIGTGERD